MGQTRCRFFAVDDVLATLLLLLVPVSLELLPATAPLAASDSTFERLGSEPVPSITTLSGAR